MSIDIKQLTNLLDRASKVDSPLAKECRQAADDLRRGELDLIFVNSVTDEQVRWPISDLVSSGTPIDDDSGDDLDLWVEDERK